MIVFLNVFVAGVIWNSLTTGALSKVLREHQNSCSISEFSCGDDSCISLNKYCDGLNDCLDGSDEASCFIGSSPPGGRPVLRRERKQVRCREDEWRCRDGSCIHYMGKCNGTVECSDGSDEETLICKSNVCEPGQFRCEYGGCVPHAAMCDGVRDCADNSDELRCPNITQTQRTPFFGQQTATKRWKRQSTCRRSQFQCRDGTCIPFHAKCDGVKDCPDGSDETFPLCRNNNKCQSNWFRCTYGACVDGTAPCNGIQECADNSDELLPRCRNETEEVKGSFKCDNGDMIPAVNHCDGVPDCSDGSDETVRACAAKTCPSYLFQCAYGACVDKGSDCNNKQECADGSDESDELCNRTTTVTPSPTMAPIVGGACILPAPPKNGRFIVANAPNAQPGQAFRTIALNITCDLGYSIIGKAERICLDGMWSGDIADCVRFCRLKFDPSITYRCVFTGNSDGTRPCNEYEPDGTLVRPECNAPNYYSTGLVPNMRCINGNWDNQAVCTPGLSKNGTNITIIIKDKIEIHISGFQYGGSSEPIAAVTESGVEYNVDEGDWRINSNQPNPNANTVSPNLVFNRKPGSSLTVSTGSSSGKEGLNFNIANSTVVVNAADKIVFRDD